MSEEKGVVGVSAAVVAHGCLNVLRQRTQITEKLFHRLRGPLIVAFQGGIQLGHIPLMMLGVVDLHRASIDVRLQSVIGVFQFGKCVGH